MHRVVVNIFNNRTETVSLSASNTALDEDNGITNFRSYQNVGTSGKAVISLAVSGDGNTLPKSIPNETDDVTGRTLKGIGKTGDLSSTVGVLGLRRGSDNVPESYGTALRVRYCMDGSATFNVDYRVFLNNNRVYSRCFWAGTIRSPQYIFRGTAASGTTLFGVNDAGNQLEPPLIEIVPVDDSHDDNNETVVVIARIGRLKGDNVQLWLWHAAGINATTSKPLASVTITLNNHDSGLEHQDSDQQEPKQQLSVSNGNSSGQSNGDSTPTPPSALETAIQAKIDSTAQHGDNHSNRIWRGALAAVRGEQPTGDARTVDQAFAQRLANNHGAKGRAELSQLWQDIADALG